MFDLTGRGFRRHVAGRPEHRAGQRQVQAALDTFGQTKIGHMRFTLRIEKDVGRLQIAMKDAPLMRVVNGAGGLSHDLRGPIPRSERLPVLGIRDEPGEVAVLDQFHGEVMVTPAFPHFVNGNDVRMVQAGGRGRFRAKPFHLAFAGQQAGPNHLQSDPPVQADLTGPIHNPHAALRQFLHQFVVAQKGGASPGFQTTRRCLAGGGKRAVGRPLHPGRMTFRGQVPQRDLDDAGLAKPL